MSDPLSVAAGVIGIVTAAAQISSLLVKFTANVKDAPGQASIVLTEVSDTSSILAQLQPFLLGLDTPDQSRTCLLQVESIIAILTGCVATFSELQQVLDSLEIEEMRSGDRLKWSRKESAIAALLTRLQTHKASLSLMLNVLTCNTMSEVKTSVDSLQKSMQQSYLEILVRVRGLENQRANSSLDTTAVTKKDTEEHGGGVYDLSEESSSIQKATTLPSRSFSRFFEKDLAMTRAYKRINWRGSISSIFTTEHPKTRWSTFSDLSVADVISRLSVYELAITFSDIHKSQQYTPFLGDEIERASPDNPDENIVGTTAIVPGGNRTTYPSPGARTVNGHELRMKVDAYLRETARTYLSQWKVRGLDPRFAQMNAQKYPYVTYPLENVLLDQVTKALKYFHLYRDMALSLTTGQVLRDVLRMLGLPETENYDLFIFSDDAMVGERLYARIHKLTPGDVPLGIVEDLHWGARRPRLAVQPKTTKLPSAKTPITTKFPSRRFDVTDINLGHLGHAVGGWLLHEKLYHLHVRNPNHPLT